MQSTINFSIHPNGEISDRFIKMGISDFDAAAAHIKTLPYKRNKNKENPFCVFNDSGGTCSTKHALLKKLATENSITEIKLILGIFMMNKNNTSAVSRVLNKYNLQEMPEAHTYLKFQNQTLDFTSENSSPTDFLDHLLIETEILPSQITTFKIKYHQNFLRDYLYKNPAIPYDSESFWRIREECIYEL